MIDDMTTRPFAANLLAGRTALVTGGGSGLGRAIAEGLSAAGANLVIAARRKDRLDLAAQEIRAATGNPVDVDLVDTERRSRHWRVATRSTSSSTTPAGSSRRRRVTTARTDGTASSI